MYLQHPLPSPSPYSSIKPDLPPSSPPPPPQFQSHLALLLSNHHHISFPQPLSSSLRSRLNHVPPLFPRHNPHPHPPPPHPPPCLANLSPQLPPPTPPPPNRPRALSRTRPLRRRLHPRPLPRILRRTRPVLLPSPPLQAQPPSDHH